MSDNQPYHIRRRPRLCKTCLPCRASKVRCDRNVPCGNCTKRNFTCSYSQSPLSTVAPIPAPLSGPNTPNTSAHRHLRQQEPLYPSSLAATPSSIPSVQFTPDLHSNQRVGNKDTSVYGSGDKGSGGIYSRSEYGDSQDSLSSSSQDNVTISQGEWDEIHSKMGTMENILASLHSLFQSHSGCRKDPGLAAESQVQASSTSGEGPTESDQKQKARQTHVVARPETYRSDPLKSGPIHIGSRSALVDILDKSKKSDDTAKALPKDDLLAELALGNQSVAYPFVDLWSSDPFTFNIAAVCDVLPADEHCHRYLLLPFVSYYFAVKADNRTVSCRRFFGFYRDIGSVLYPVLSDNVDLEDGLHELLRNRAQAGGQYRPNADGLVKPFGMSLGFVSLLFAVLASGCQLSDLPTSERELTSWVYVSCSYQCLRMMNYVSQPTVEVIQVLLIISNVLSYNMNAGASYTLLGMTERMCLVLGMHVETPGFSWYEQTVRRRVWWTMAFQNSHFSLAYDRPSITMFSQPEIPFDRKSMPGHRTYFDSLCRVVSLALEVLRGRLDPEQSHIRYHDIREYKQRVHRILAEAAPHLRFPDHCHSLSENIERNELHLHSCYVLSVLCRVSLDPDSHLDDQRRAIIRQDCISNLIGTIEAFVELHSIHPHCSRLWISVQRAIACAFLLVSQDGQSHPKTMPLVQQLQHVLADHVQANGAADSNIRTDSAKHLASSLRALREITATFQARQLKTPDSEFPAIASSNPQTISTPFPLTASGPATGSGSGSGQLARASLTSTPTSLTGDNNSISDYNQTPIQQADMRDILDGVSDVMLFPRLSPI